MSETAPETPLAVSPLREQASIERGLAMDATTFDGIHSVFSNGTAFQLATKMATMLASSTIMPEAYQNNPSNCLIAIDYAARLNVSPVQLAQNMDVVKGRPGLRGTFLAALINACPLFGRLKYEWRGEDNPGKEPALDFGCRAYAKEAESGEVLYGAWIDWRMVKGEKWDGNSKWTHIRQQMFMYRAASFWSRAHASDVTLGLYEADELHDMQGTTTVRTLPNPSRISDLGERLAQRAAAAIEHEQPAVDDKPADMNLATGEIPPPASKAEVTDAKKLNGKIFAADTLDELAELEPLIALLPEAERHDVNDMFLKRHAQIKG